MVPAESALIPNFDSIMLHMKAYDSPADGKSSFQVLNIMLKFYYWFYDFNLYLNLWCSIWFSFHMGPTLYGTTIFHSSVCLLSTNRFSVWLPSSAIKDKCFKYYYSPSELRLLIIIILITDSSAAGCTFIKIYWCFKNWSCWLYFGTCMRCLENDNPFALISFSALRNFA